MTETLNRRNNIKLLGSTLLLVAVVLFGCKKSDPAEEIDLGYDYFPNVVGTYIEYYVDSTSFGVSEQNFTFWLREELTESFVDDEGQVAIRVTRYKRQSEEGEWVQTDVWTQKRTTTTSERVEENQRFVRLAFPVNAEQSWDGNAYNTMDEWQHTYSGIGTAKTIGGLQYSNTVTVEQRNNVNLVDQEIASEIYAYGVGLVQKSFTDLSFQNFEVTGVQMTMMATDYGLIE